MKPKKMLISPTKLASRRTKNRIVEHGAIFVVERFNATHVCLRATETDWLGWLPRNEFHIELIDSAVDKFMIDKD